MIKDLPIFNSKLDHIHPITIVKSSDVKRYGISACFKHIVNELKTLWDKGIKLQSPDTDSVREIKIKMCQSTGDNLGVHQVLGFNESFSSNYPCRFCKAHRTLCQSQTRCDPDLARNASDFSDPAAFDNPAETGIKERSVFYDLPYFCVSKNKAADLMHDILEGVAKYDLNVIIPNLISKGYFDLNHLNSVISSFNFGRVYSKTRPSLFKTSNLPNLSASQIFCLVQCITLMVGDKVPTDDPCWELLLYLRDIIDLTFSASISEPGIEHLRCKIEDHHESYIQVSGEQLKPKFHFLLHYPDIIRAIGPLKQYWVMRFEAKHRFAKRIANNICNFKNICKSVAERYQLSMIQSFKGNYYSGNIEALDGELVSVKDTIFADQILTNLNITDGNILLHGNIDLFGTNLRSNDMMLYKFGDDELCFGMIRQIFSYDNQVYIVLHMHCIKYFSHHFHAYSLQQLNNYAVVKATDIAHHHPLHVFQDSTGTNNEIFVTCPVVYI